MLVRFNVGNFLSFDDIQEFSLLKGKVKKKNNRIYKANNTKLLKFSAIFGANASGKSNLISSMMYVRSAIIYGIPQKGKISSFKLDPNNKSKPSYFEFEMIIDGNNYSYGFEIYVETRQLVSEWLIELSPMGNDKNIFIRDVEKGIFDDLFNINSEILTNKLNVFSDEIKSNNKILFLAEMNRAKGELYKENSELIIFKKVYEWFKNNLDINYPDALISKYSYFRDNENKEEICRIINSLGTGITDFNDIKVSKDDLEQQLPSTLIREIEKIISDMIDSNDFNKTISVMNKYKKVIYIISVNESDKDYDVRTIVFNHGTDVNFSFNEESDGTIRILDLIEILLSKEDKVYVIDEIDRSLHPQLTYKFIAEYLRVSKERKIQLIVTTHESRLLDFNLLRQDEIWITNKNKIGATELYSLDEYNVRFDKKIDKAYLEGRYGGVPIFQNIFPIEEDE